MADTRGRQLHAADGPDPWFALEHAGRVDGFDPVEQALLAAVTDLLAGRDVITITEHSNRTQTLSLARGDAELVEQTWSESAQNARGAWWLQGAQTDVSISLLTPRLVKLGDTALASIPTPKVKASPASGALMFTAVVLEPALQTLLAPLLLRSLGAPKDVAKRQAAWGQHLGALDLLGLADGPVGAAARRIGPDGDWRRLDRAGRQQLRLEYLTALKAHVTIDTIRRLRLVALAELVDGVYGKAKKATGTGDLVMPLAKTVLTKARQPVLSAWFGGDWLALLRYLGESANPSEQLVTRLPETPLTVVTPDAVDRVAADTGLSTDAVEDILRAYHDPGAAAPDGAPAGAAVGSTGAGISGVHDRIAAVRLLFDRLGELQSRQELTGPSAVNALTDESHVLGSDLLSRVSQLWGGVCLPRYPDKVVTRLWPLDGAVEAAGVALTFWHEVFLTCWYTCAGPYARAEIKALEEYYGRHYQPALNELGFGVDRSLFTDLIAASKKLGRAKPITDNSSTKDIGHGLSITISMSSGSTRSGFEHLRDVVAAHRAAWMRQHLDAYLDQAWRGPVESVAREFQRTVAAKGKPPTHKQFGALGAKAATAWFGGSLEALYGAIGERAAAPSVRVDATHGRGTEVRPGLFTRLGGDPLAAKAKTGDYKAQTAVWMVRDLTRRAEKWIQLYEALGQPPTFKEIGGDQLRGLDGQTPEATFERLSTEILATLADLDGARPQPPTTPAPAPPAAAPPPLSAVPPAPTAAPAAASSPPPPAYQPPPQPQPQPAKPEKQGLLSRFRRR